MKLLFWSFHEKFIGQEVSVKKFLIFTFVVLQVLTYDIFHYSNLNLKNYIYSSV